MKHQGFFLSFICSFLLCLCFHQGQAQVSSTTKEKCFIPRNGWGTLTDRYLYIEEQLYLQLTRLSTLYSEANSLIVRLDTKGNFYGWNTNDFRQLSTAFSFLSCLKDNWVKGASTREEDEPVFGHCTTIKLDCVPPMKQYSALATDPVGLSYYKVGVQMNIPPQNMYEASSDTLIIQADLSLEPAQLGYWVPAEVEEHSVDEFEKDNNMGWEVWPK